MLSFWMIEKWLDMILKHCVFANRGNKIIMIIMIVVDKPLTNIIRWKAKYVNVFTNAEKKI